MMDDDLIPQGGLRSTRQPVGTFTPTQYTHPDALWHPLGGEFQQGHGMSLTSSDGQGGTSQQNHAEPGHPDPGEGFDLQGTMRVVRSALRPGN